MWMVSIAVPPEPHAPRRSSIRRLPWDSAIGRSATSASSAIRATEIALSDNASASAPPTGPPPAIATSTLGRSAATNDSLDVTHGFRRARGQHLASRRGHDDVVLDAHADVPERFRDAFGGPHVAPRLDREGHARLQAPPLPARLVFAGVVDVEAEPMAGAVHVEAPVVFGLDDFLDRSVAQAEVDEPLRERGDRGVVRLVPAPAGPHHGDRRALGREHEL